MVCPRPCSSTNRRAKLFTHRHTGTTQRCEVRALTPSLSQSPPHVCHRQGPGLFEQARTRGVRWSFLLHKSSTEMQYAICNKDVSHRHRRHHHLYHHHHHHHHNKTAVSDIQSRGVTPRAPGDQLTFESYQTVAARQTRRPENIQPKHDHKRLLRAAVRPRLITARAGRPHLLPILWGSR